MADAVAVQVDGLKETLKFLQRVDPAMKKEAVSVMQEGTKTVQTAARARLRSAPGVSGRYKLSAGAVIRRASGSGASVGINRASSRGRNAAIFGAEFGAKGWHVPRGRTGESRGLSQQSMRRRVFPVWRGNSTTVRGRSGPGWVVLPTLRKLLPKIEKQMARDMQKVVVKASRKSGANG